MLFASIMALIVYLDW